MTKTSKTVQKHIGLEGINERIMTIRIRGQIIHKSLSSKCAPELSIRKMK